MEKKIIKNCSINYENTIKISNNSKKINNKPSNSLNESGNSEEKSSQMLLEAQKKREQIIAEAEAEGEEIYKTQKKEGYEKGYSEGYKYGLKEASIEKKKILEEVTQIKRNAHKDYKELIESSENEILEIIMEITDKLIYDKLDEDKNLILKIIKETIKKSTQKKEVLLFVSGDDFNTVINSRDLLISKIDGLESLEICHDETMNPGSCKVETKGGSIIYDMKDNIKSLKKTFKELVNN